MLVLCTLMGLSIFFMPGILRYDALQILQSLPDSSLTPDCFYVYLNLGLIVDTSCRFLRIAICCLKISVPKLFFFWKLTMLNCIFVFIWTIFGNHFVSSFCFWKLSLHTLFPPPNFFLCYLLFTNGLKNQAKI